MPNSPILAGTQVVVLWVPVPGATKYNIYLDGKKVGESATIQFILPSPEKAGEYKIQVAAVDDSGKEGAKSSPGVIKIFTIEPPKGLLGRGIGNNISLRWDKTKGAIVYNLFRAEKQGGPFKLISSVQGESYTDSDVSKGKTYYYAVSAKDLAGKESKRSDVSMVSIPAEVVVGKEVTFDFKAVPSVETGRLGFLGGKRLSGVSDVKVDRSGEVWIVQGNVLYRASAAGELIGQIGPVEGVKKFFKLDFGPDGTVYVSDVEGNAYAMRRSGEITWKVALPKPPADKKGIWAGMPAHIAQNYKPIAGDVLVKEDELWVTDQVFALIYVLDLSGNFKRYIYEYTSAEGKTVRLGGVGEMEILPDGRILMAFPVAHYAIIFDGDMKELVTIGKAGTGFIGRFIGIHGVSVLRNGNILLTDPAVNSMQVFDGKTGAYLYHIGEDKATEDPGQPGRAFLSFGSVAFAQFVNDQNFLVYTGTEKAVLFRRLTGKL